VCPNCLDNSWNSSKNGGHRTWSRDSAGTEQSARRCPGTSDRGAVQQDSTARALSMLCLRTPAYRPHGQNVLVLAGTAESPACSIYLNRNRAHICRSVGRAMPFCDGNYDWTWNRICRELWDTPRRSNR
jgi:hypothetical protein